MAYIRTVPPEESAGTLRREYARARGRAGKVWNILRVMSPNAETLAASMALYLQVMHAPSPLTRAVREMLAIVVSQANDCHY